MSQRGTRFFDICSVMTCASSCHSVAPQLNSPGGRALRRIERDHAAEAGAERADHAGQPDVRTAKSSCFGNISIRIGPVGVNWYCFESVASASLRERHRVLAHDRGFLGIEAEDEVAVGDRLELVERVEQREQVVRLTDRRHRP